MLARPLRTTQSPPSSEISQWMRANAHKSWGMTEDRSARTANARAAFQERFLIEAGGDTVRAESLRKSYYATLAAKSAQARRRNREARQALGENGRERDRIAAVLSDADLAETPDGP